MQSIERRSRLTGVDPAAFALQVHPPRRYTDSPHMLRHCPACHRVVGPIVLLTMTARWTFACRRCWATIRATRPSAVIAGFAGAAAGALILVTYFMTQGHALRRGGGLPAALAFVTSRLLPTFEVEDPPLQAPDAG
jgi:hypothetical protein